MSSRQDNLDPRLSAADFSTNQLDPSPVPPPPTSFARPNDGKLDSGAYNHSPQPYYRYPSPHAQTPSLQGGHHGSNTQSNQESPDENHAGYAVDGEASPDHGADGGGADDQKRARACEACRGLKVRCDQDPAHPEIPCRRCAKAGRQCIITQPSRKRQKKADSRVAELEKKLDALTAALQQKQQHPQSYASQGPGASPTDPAMSHGNQSISTSASFGHQTAKRKRSTEENPDETPTYDGAGVVVNTPISRQGSNTNRLPAPHHHEINTWSPLPDSRRYLSYQNADEFVKRINSLINPELASTVFNRYINDLCPNMPAVIFPAGMTAERVFKERPILYLCILSAASAGLLHPELAREINREAISTIADCVVRCGAKSLELIQAMQVIALWYKPPEQAEATNFYQIIHMAAVMALDIGLGKRFNPSKARRGFGGPNANFAPGPGKAIPQDSDTLEARRAWLACYYLCARPNLVRWTNYMKESLEVLETHPDAMPSDRLFCQYVKIQHICEDIGLQFLMDDNTATISIKDPKVTYALNVLEGQLKNWKENIPPDCRNKGMQFFEHVTSLYLHEIALHFNHNIDDFRLPFTEESLKSVNNSSDTLTPSQMAALEACLKAAHGILDTMMSYEVSIINALPMLIWFVRCVYAIVILIKMHVAVCTPHSELGKMIRPDDLRVDYYLDGLIGLFALVLKREGCAPHPKILRILNVLREWFSKHKENVNAQQRGEQQAFPYSSDQTPLHVLSSIATGTRQQQQQQPTASGSSKQSSVAASTPENNGDWTFDHPTVTNITNYGGKPLQPPTSHPEQQQQQHHQHHQQQQTTRGAPPQVDYPVTDAYGLPIDSNMVDPMNPADFGWGTGFEQAMDLALGGMDGLQGGGLDSWFLGDSVAPFGFQGDMVGPAPVQQWQ